MEVDRGVDTLKEKGCEDRDLEHDRRTPKPQLFEEWLAKIRWRGRTIQHEDVEQLLRFGQREKHGKYEEIERVKLNGDVVAEVQHDDVQHYGERDDGTEKRGAAKEK